MAALANTTVKLRVEIYRGGFFDQLKIYEGPQKGLCSMALRVVRSPKEFVIRSYPH